VTSPVDATLYKCRPRPVNGYIQAVAMLKGRLDIHVWLELTLESLRGFRAPSHHLAVYSASLAPITLSSHGKVAPSRSATPPVWRLC
jgi:hypothetical protein